MLAMYLKYVFKILVFQILYNSEKMQAIGYHVAMTYWLSQLLKQFYEGRDH